MKDVFQLQSEISGEVAKALQVVLDMGDRAQATNAGAAPVNVDAYNLLLEGKYFDATDSEEGTRKAVTLYQQAIDHDPKFAMAWARLGHAYMAQANAGWLPIKQTNEKARAALQHALQLDPASAYAHLQYSRLHVEYDWDWNAGRIEAQRACDLDPSNLEARAQMIYITDQLWGRFDRAIALERQILARNPLESGELFSLGVLLEFSGQLDEAIVMLRRSLEFNPNNATAPTYLAYALLYQGKAEEALTVLNTSHDDGWAAAGYPVVYWALGRRAESDAALERLIREFGDGASGNVPDMYAYRGQIDEAFQWLDRAYHQRDINLLYIRFNPLLSNLRGDARYQAFLHKMKLDGYGLPPADSPP
jgi:tetratricopeptide (TPR) repeat protein